MRLFLLPITSSRTLLYCQRLNVATVEKQNLVDKATTRAAKLWAGWEKKESGWQKRVVDYGNYALRRISYEEWGLKSVPPISSRRKDEELKGKDKIELVFPNSIIPSHKVEGVLATLATEREALHKRKLIWSCIGMPLAIPFALVPVIPNLPFFYLAYRAWSHWRALAGGKHLRFLLTNNLLTLAPSKVLDEVYTPTLPSAQDGPSQPATGNAEPLEGKSDLAAEEDILLTRENAKQIAQALDLPEVEVELERAIWQVNAAKMAKEKENANEKQAKADASASQQPPGATKPDEKKSQ